MRKGCKLYGVKIAKLLLNENPTSIRDHPALSEFMEVFPKEIPGLLVSQEIYFSIGIIHGYALASKVTYRITIHELAELKI